MFKSACWTYEHKPTRRRCRSFLAKSNPGPLDMASHWFCWTVPILLKMWCPDSCMAYHIHVRYIYIIMYCNIPHPRHFWYAFHALFSLFTFHKSTSCQGTKTDFCILLYINDLQTQTCHPSQNLQKDLAGMLETCHRAGCAKVLKSLNVPLDLTFASQMFTPHLPRNLPSRIVCSSNSMWVPTTLPANKIAQTCVHEI